MFAGLAFAPSLRFGRLPWFQPVGSTFEEVLAPVFSGLVWTKAVLGFLRPGGRVLQNAIDAVEGPWRLSTRRQTQKPWTAVGRRWSQVGVACHFIEEQLFIEGQRVIDQIAWHLLSCLPCIGRKTA